jgi:hypothetical protein
MQQRTVKRTAIAQTTDNSNTYGIGTSQFLFFFPIPLVLQYRREEKSMMDFIKWFAALMHKDMQDYRMDKNTDISIYRKIRKKWKENGGTPK